MVIDFTGRTRFDRHFFSSCNVYDSQSTNGARFSAQSSAADPEGVPRSACFPTKKLNNCPTVHHSHPVRHSTLNLSIWLKLPEDLSGITDRTWFEAYVNGMAIPNALTIFVPVFVTTPRHYLNRINTRRSYSQINTNHRLCSPYHPFLRSYED